MNKIKKNIVFSFPFILNKKSLLSPLIAIMVGLSLSVFIVLCTARDPLVALRGFFTGPFSSPYYIGGLLNTLSLLCFASVGVAISQKSGNLNLGGEGQIYLSGFLTAVLLPLFPQEFSVVTLPVAAFIVSCLVGSIGLICGLLKAYRNANEVLTSFLFSAIIIYLVDYGVNIFKDQTKNLLAMPLLPDWFRLDPLLNPSRLNNSLFIALLLIVFVTFFLYQTRRGYIFRLCGTAPEFSYYSGYSPKKVTVWGLFFSAFFHGLAGFFAVVGTYYTCYVGFYAGMGWNALTASLIARANPIAILPACFLMAFLLTSTQYASLTNTITMDANEIIFSAMLLCISAQFVLGRKDKA